MSNGLHTRTDEYFAFQRIQDLPPGVSIWTSRAALRRTLRKASTTSSASSTTRSMMACNSIDASAEDRMRVSVDLSRLKIGESMAEPPPREKNEINVPARPRLATGQAGCKR